VVPFVYLSLSCWAARILLRNSSPIPIAFRVFPALSCTNFRVSGLILRSLIYFALILAQGDRHGSSFSFLQVGNHFSQQHLLKRVSFSSMCFGPFVKKKKGAHSCVDSYLGPLFCSTGLHIYFCASAMLFLLLWLCNIFRSWVL
jgi:hypothetical protein